MRQTRVFIYKSFFVLIIFILLATGCNQLPGSGDTFSIGGANPTATPSLTNTRVITITPTITPESTFTPTITPSNTPSPTATKFKLDSFSYNFMPNEVSARTYQDTCEYLSNRWGEGKSKPGTILVPIMYHSVRKSGRELQDNMQVTQEYFEYTMNYAKKLGFETITTDELVGFLYENKEIPPLSMIMIIDDRRLGVVREHFLTYLDQYDWTMTLAYITGVATPFEWNEFDRLNVNHQLDMQAHGFYHNGETYITDTTPLDVIEQEIYGPIPLIEEHTGEKPLAFIWPGGNFNTEAVQIAREAGYQVGFTVFARGPLMYNWIPLGPEEAKINDPLMVLPRIWSTTATIDLEKAVEISSKAAAFANDNKKLEYLWYETNCSNYPPLVEEKTIGR